MPLGSQAGKAGGEPAPQAREGAPDPAPPRRRGRRAARHALGGLWHLAMLGVVFALIAGFGLIGREITAPSWIKTRIEAQAADLLGGGTLGFGRITVAVGPDLHPVVRLRDTDLRDRDGRRIARIPLIAVTLSPRGLVLARQVLPQAVVFEGAQLSLSRAADGRLAIALGGGQRIDGLPDLAALSGMIDAILESPGLEALRRAELRGLGADFRDARAGRTFHVDGGTVTVDLTGGHTRAEADLGILSGRSYATTLHLSYDSPRYSRAATFDLSVTDAAAADIASQSPALGWLSVLDARLSGSVRAELDAAGNLSGMRATLGVGAGALAPAEGAAPLTFDNASAEVRYDPASGRLDVDRLSVQSDWGTLRASGQSRFESRFESRIGSRIGSPPEDGPAPIIGQFVLAGAALDPAGLLSRPAALPPTSVDLRLSFDPFALEIGQIAVEPAADGGSGQLVASGRITAGEEGWGLALDGVLRRVTVARLGELWPEGFLEGSRHWYLGHVSGGEITDLTMGLRMVPGGAPHMALSHDFREATVTLLDGLPPITGGAGSLSLDGQAFSVVFAAGQVSPPQGGTVDMAGTSYTIADLTARPQVAVLDLAARGPITALLSLADQPPLHLVAPSGLPVDMASGAADLSGPIRIPQVFPMPPGSIGADLHAVLGQVESDRLVPGRLLAATRLDLGLTMTGLTVEGAATLDGVPFTGRFTTGFGAGALAGQVSGQVALSPGFFETFGIGLPQGMLTGSGTGDFTIDLPQGAPPRYALTSDLRGLVLSIPAVGWHKGRDRAGTLEVAGHLGARPTVETLILDAAGLRATGRVDLAPGGGLERAAFSRVTLDGWLDAAPLALVGRGAGRAPGVEIGGGMLDLRFATLGGSAGADGGGDGTGVGTGGGPMGAAQVLVNPLSVFTPGMFREIFRRPPPQVE